MNSNESPGEYRVWRKVYGLLSAGIFLVLIAEMVGTQQWLWVWILAWAASIIMWLVSQRCLLSPQFCGHIYVAGLYVFPLFWLMETNKNYVWMFIPALIATTLIYSGLKAALLITWVSGTAFIVVTMSDSVQTGAITLIGYLTLAAMVRVLKKDAVEKAVSHEHSLRLIRSQALATMSHDLKTPLNTVIGYATLLQEFSDNLTDEEKVDVASIVRASRQLEIMLNNLLGTAKIEAGFELGPTTEITLGELLDSSVNFVDTIHDERYPAQFEINAEGDYQKVTISCDRKRVQQALIDIIYYAFLLDETGKIQIDVGKTPQILSIKIKNTVASVDARTAANLFDVDTNIHIRPNILVAHKIAVLHGGGLYVKTQSPGVEFVFTLPMTLVKS